MINYRLCAEVIKFWRSDAEERALGEYILRGLDIDLAKAQSYSLEELTNVLRNNIERCTVEEKCKCEEVFENKVEEISNVNEGQDADERQNDDTRDASQENDDVIPVNFKDEIKRYTERKRGRKALV